MGKAGLVLGPAEQVRGRGCQLLFQFLGGTVDRLAGDVKSHPVSPKDILATILHLMGIDAHTTIPDQQDRPVPVAGTGVLRPEIFRGV